MNKIELIARYYKNDKQYIIIEDYSNEVLIRVCTTTKEETKNFDITMDVADELLINDGIEYINPCYAKTFISDILEDDEYINKELAYFLIRDCWNALRKEG